MGDDRPILDAPGGPMACFFAAPEGRPPAPGVVVVQEWWGLNGQIEGVARRLAGEGFAALAPDLYRGKQADEPHEARKLSMQLDRGRALQDLRAAVGWLLEHGAGAVGAIGFCMGGSITFELACIEERLGAAVPFYGLSDLRERTITCPVQAHFGTADRFDPELLDDVAWRLGDLGNGSELHRYEGAPHAFMNETRRSYRPQAAAVAWERAISFLRANLS
ncbi:MAG TPA: dienelactone hydrolase family protein [Actinomycetota bacterium]|nr:dienelactone hydrolase family protein [Actinomycetota bacterium]